MVSVQAPLNRCILLIMQMFQLLMLSSLLLCVECLLLWFTYVMTAFIACGFKVADDSAKTGRHIPYRDGMVFKLYNKNLFLGEGGYEAASRLVRKDTEREKERAAR